jgi:hypothetical protein
MRRMFNMDRYNQRWVNVIFNWHRYSGFAVTIGQTTYYSCDKSLVTDRWRRHEDKHKEQYRRLGMVGFLIRYFYYQIKYGYMKNPLEVEAQLVE